MKEPDTIIRAVEEGYLKNSFEGQIIYDNLDKVRVSRDSKHDTFLSKLLDTLRGYEPSWSGACRPGLETSSICYNVLETTPDGDIYTKKDFIKANLYILAMVFLFEKSITVGVIHAVQACPEMRACVYLSNSVSSHLLTFVTSVFTDGMLKIILRENHE